MTGWASISFNDTASPDLGLILEGDDPFKIKNASEHYPPLVLDTKRASPGCYATAASLYLSIGVFALSLVLARVILGPS